MTDKQIIYNCPHISLTDWGTYACKLYNPRDKNCLVKGGNCDSNISCPYKQFRAKEQECDQLKVENLSLKRGIEIAKEADKSWISQLKAENDELRMKNRILETECNEMRDVCNEFEQYYESLMEGHKKLKQTLTEIKEIAEIAVNFCKGCGGEDYECIDCTNGGRAQISKEILQKISEVEND